MTSTRTILMLILQATLVGCQTGGRTPVVHHFDPVLSNTMSCEQLVDHLNSQHKGLQSWQCTDTRVYVSMPGVPLPQKLSGSISCSAPSSFRLTADNFVAQADFGSNEDLCWAYVKPGEPVVMTWHHEDSHLLEYVPGGFPRLDPDWLMVVLGVQPLHADDFQIQRPPAGSKELWLVSIEESAAGKPLRRVIKVDPVTGVAREHSLVDHNGDYLLRAHLSEHRSCDGSLIPHRVKISFPSQKTELKLEFKDIEANCSIKESMWVPPGEGRIAQRDLGDYLRQTHGDLPPRPGIRNKKLAEDPRDDRMYDGTLDQSDESEGPDFDNDISFETPLPGEQSFPRGRFYGEGEGELDPQDPIFDSPDFEDDGLSNTSVPIRKVAFQEEPDFDVVAPGKTPRSRFRLNPFQK